MAPELRLLVAECEPPDARSQRRRSVGRSSGETYLEVLRALAPGAACERIKPADEGEGLPSSEALSHYDGVFLTGSPLHLYEETSETRREVVFMQAVFASGTPAFGSCAGLQVATVAAGGTVRPNASGREAAFARKITPTAHGRSHPLLEGRPAVFDAPAVHTDEVASLPARSVVLACNEVTRVQAAEIRSGERGIFWGVQYHPEIGLDEVAAALVREASSLVDAGLAGSDEDVESYAGQVEALHHHPTRRDLAWRLGLDEQVTEPHLRRAELRNFIAHLVRPTRAKRGRG
jgi:GMP synthase (glutamine-hydrolysing)